MKRFPLLLAALLLALAPLRATQTDNHGIHAVPAPARVTIDGQLGEWDLSGAVLMCYDLESLRDTYSAQVAMMHDAEALYVAIHWKDAIPIGNSHDPRFQANKGWAGDCVQLRFKTDRIAHITAWCYAPAMEPAIQVDYGKSLTEPFKGGSKVLPRIEGWKMGEGAEMAFAKDADSKGYVQEIKLPWKLITAEKIPQPGERFACGVELLWGEADWPIHRYADNLADGASSREFFFTAHNSWGPVMLEPEGNLKLPEPAYLQASRATEEMSGPIEIKYDLPADGRVTLAIDAASGRRVRNLVPARPRKAGANSEHWDGLDDDGRLAPPGDYVFKALRHDGIHANWTMSFANPGNPSWGTTDGRGAFYGDHTAPQAAAAAGEFVALACPMGEGGQHLIGCNLDGQRLWGLANRTAFDGGHISLATDGKLLWVATEGKESIIYRVEMATGRYVPWKQAAAGDAVLDLRVSEQPGVQAKGSPGVNMTAIALDSKTNRLAVCLARENKVELRDAMTGEVKTTIDLEEPRSAVFMRDGGLLTLSRGALVGIDASEKRRAFSTDNFPDGYGLAADSEGNVYLSVRGAEQNMKVFSPDGKVVREIGKRGGRPAYGAYDETAMRNPAQPAVDARGRLWGEETSNPKRTSLWNAHDGSLIKDLAGTLSYAGAGSINPDDPTMAFADETVFRIDLATGAWRPVYSLGKRDDPADLFPAGTGVGDSGRGGRAATRASSIARGARIFSRAATATFSTARNGAPPHITARSRAARAGEMSSTGIRFSTGTRERATRGQTPMATASCSATKSSLRR